MNINVNVTTDTEWEIKHFPWQELSNAPDTPGLYAWYYRTKLRKADLHSAEQTKGNLIKVARSLRMPDMNATAAGHFNLSFSGRLQHNHLYEYEDASGLVDMAINDDSERIFFANTLLLSTPFFSPPLYIGVSENIRTRLKSHKDEIQSQGDNPGHSFAQEVKSRGMDPIDLSVFTFTSASILHNCNKDAKQTFQAVETILNRLYNPIFGRR